MTELATVRPGAAGRRRLRFLRAPATHAAWAAFEVAALAATAFAEPYLFAYATIGLSWLSAAMGGLGLVLAFAGHAPPRHRRAIVVAVIVEALALFAALAWLRTFHWA